MLFFAQNFRTELMASKPQCGILYMNGPRSCAATLYIAMDDCHIVSFPSQFVPNLNGYRNTTMSSSITANCQVEGMVVVSSSFVVVKLSFRCGPFDHHSDAFLHQGLRLFILEHLLTDFFVQTGRSAELSSRILDLSGVQHVVCSGCCSVLVTKRRHDHFLCFQWNLCSTRHNDLLMAPTRSKAVVTPRAGGWRRWWDPTTHRCSCRPEGDGVAGGRCRRCHCRAAGPPALRPYALLFVNHSISRSSTIP